jgi:hypothetical protein
MDATTRIEMLAQAMHDSDLIDRSPLRGCSDEEIRRLELRYQITLPASYRRFLQLMGHSAANLGSNPGELLYPAVFNRTAEERATCDRVNRDTWDLEMRRFCVRVDKLLRRLGIPVHVAEVPDEVHYSLPDDGLIIYYSSDLPTFWMIRCNDPMDSPVYTFDYEGWTIELKRDYESVHSFLEMLLSEELAQRENGR